MAETDVEYQTLYAQFVELREQLRETERKLVAAQEALAAAHMAMKIARRAP